MAERAWRNYTFNRATLAQDAGIFFWISIPSKMLLSRAPCFRTHAAIAPTPSCNDFISCLPKMLSALA